MARPTCRCAGPATLLNAVRRLSPVSAGHSGGRARWADLVTAGTGVPAVNDTAVDIARWWADYMGGRCGGDVLSGTATVDVSPVAADGRSPGGLVECAPGAAEVLARAAALVQVVAQGPVLSTDLTEVMLAAVADLAPCLGAVRRRELVDVARELLAMYLVAVGEAEPDQRVGVALHGWLMGRTVTELERSLSAAAPFCRQVGVPVGGRRQS